MSYQPVIGLEIHIELNTKTKMFCGCSTSFGAPPNTNICPICTGQPGVLPVANKKAIEMTIKTALALNCKINSFCVFARKNYFYPDLPKNYQISQYEQPFAEHGFLEIEIKDKKKKIGIKRVHLEEDTGKLLHAIGSKELDYSLVDFNRSGVPLLEIVSEPDINSEEEAYIYLSTLKNILQYIDVSDCDMEKGSLRCDANVSVRYINGPLGTKTEIKNMNSFKAVKSALEYEIKRQIELLKEGEKIVQETRLWDDKLGITQSMRSKEEAHDYRYFPEPDLVPIELDQNFIEEIKKTIPLLPIQRKEKFITEYGLSEYDSKVLTSQKELADYFEESLSILKQNYSIDKVAKLLSNWITTELLGKLNAENKDISQSPVSPENLAKLIKLILDQTISSKIAKDVFDEMFKTGKNPEDIVREKNLLQITDEKEINNLVEKAIKENPKAVQEYLSGKKQAFGAIVGYIMKISKGRANPRLVNEFLQKKLSEQNK
ncbi:MAG: Asp-tRNA(Asn)/Glu-tRNA(Gln) amidotransferase subunit GatB [Endomicrobiia bacterium]